MPYDLAAIEKEVLAGLPNERERIAEAQANKDFYRGNFGAYRVRAPDGYEPYRYERQSRFMGWAVDTLTRNLYRTGPTRKLPDHPQASDWLEGVYKNWWVDAAWQEADRAATWGGFAAFQVVGTADPDRPVDYLLWGPDELCVWADDENPRLPVAVGTIDKYDNQRRLRLWTAEEMVTYRTRKWNGDTAGGTAFERVDSVPNPYGVIPFSFVHFRMPTSCFTTDSPGCHLRKVNDWLNFTLTETGDSIRYDIRPATVAYGTYPGWTPPPMRPGLIFDLPAGDRDEGGNGPEPRLEKLQADPGYVDVTWNDLGEFLGHSLESYGIPRAAFRMEQVGVKSGIAMVAEQLPLLDWAETRQRPFSKYEEDLARLTLTVGAAHLSNNKLSGLDGVQVEQLKKAAKDPGLQLRWGRMWANLPGPDRDESDAWRMDRGLASAVEVLMERESITRDEALAKLKQVAEDNKLVAALGAVPATDPNQDQPADDGDLSLGGEAAGGGAEDED